MLFVIIDSKGGERILLVKAETETDIKARDSEKINEVMLVKARDKNQVKLMLNLKQTQQIAGIFTDVEVEALHTTKFGVIEG